MKLRLVFAILAAGLLAGCPLPEKKENKAKAKGKANPDQTKDESADVTFQGFLGRLRLAAGKRDTAMLVSMMTPDFGYRWDDAPQGETVFDYWDKNHLWGQLASVVRERWVPHEGFMVAPPQFATDPGYTGYRAGLKQIDGSWRFAYFVPPPATAAAPAPTRTGLPLPALPDLQ